MKKQHVFYFLFVVFLFSCKYNGDIVLTEDDLIKVEIGTDDFTEEINLSQIIDDFRLVRLETNEDCLIGNMNKIICYKNFILIFDLFNQNSKIKSRCNK